ncbi:hydroxymethylbilane synthase [Thermoflexales bacterium]|nr:hydroxymethylbilane synthase [Thermoflexales bacterium]
MITAKRTTLTIGTRGSTLARWQTDWVSARLTAAWPDLACSIKLFQTSGDKILDKPLPEIGGKGLFTEELEDALRSGEIDLAVHSLKDLPIEPAPGLMLGAIGEREDARDVLISRQHHTLANLPQGARVGTSSLRRAAQLLATRPDLQILPLRGNVDTRIRKALSGAGEYDAIVLAAAGVLRLGFSSSIAEYLSFAVMLPAPGQGALAVQCRATDEATRALLQPIDHAPTRSAITAERAFLEGLGGGCSAPVAAYAQAAVGGQQSMISLTGLVASTDGQHVIRVSNLGVDSSALGNELAQQALVQGARELLA